VTRRMLVRAVLTLLAGGAAAGLVACGGSAGSPTGGSVGPSRATYTEAQNGQTVKASVGAEIAITLDENPTTGYRWTMKASAGLKRLSSTFSGSGASPSPALGSGGTRTWIYRVEASGTQTLTGVYARPWETASPGAGTFSLTIAAS
jgi:inhibitor of cysteine peptidase